MEPPGTVGGSDRLAQMGLTVRVSPPGARFDDGAGGDNEVQRTMLELINQLDGFDPRGNIKVLMATNRPDTLDPALMRPGRLDRKIEFSLPDLEVNKGGRRRWSTGETVVWVGYRGETVSLLVVLDWSPCFSNSSSSLLVCRDAPTSSRSTPAP